MSGCKSGAGDCALCVEARDNGRCIEWVERVRCMWKAMMSVPDRVLVVVGWDLFCYDGVLSTNLRLLLILAISYFLPNKRNRTGFTRP